MLSATPTYASHMLDNYILHAIADENEVTLSFPGGTDHKPLLRLTMEEATPCAVCSICPMLRP